jgi:hypothetical protein
VGSVDIAVDNIFIVLSRDEKVTLENKRSYFIKSLDALNVEAIEILMAEFDIQERIKLIDEVILDSD